MTRCKATITRKTMLYKSGVEYGDYTMNHVQGCSHGCLYPCYAYLMAKRFGKVDGYSDWCEPRLVENTLELLEKELPRLRRKIKSVQLCFTTDPFMYGYEDVRDMSLAAIARLNAECIPCVVLTKGILPEELAGTFEKNIFGITIVSLDEGYREAYEPGAAPYELRIGALKRLHEAGFSTWVSMEPYPTPNIHDQNIEDVLDAVSFVNKIIFGRTNYNKTVSAYPGCKAWYNNAAKTVMRYCQENGIDFLIKKGTMTEDKA